MSFLRVNTITGKDGNNTPTFTTGIQILETSNPVAISTISVSLINVTGVVTASQFIGDGANMTGLSGMSASKCFALSVIN
jgi:hypothetical protein